MPTSAISASGTASSGVAPDVAQAGADRPRLAAAGGRRAQLRRVHPPEGDDHRHEGEGVDREAGADAEGRDQQPGDRRADDPRRLDDDAVEADRVDDPVGADHLDHEALPGRVVDRVDRAHREDREVDHPGRDDAGAGDREEADRGERHQRLGHHQQPPLREAVGEQPAPGAEEEHRQELQRRGQADRDAAAGQAEDQPERGDRLHPVAGERDDLPGEVAPVVGDGERVEAAPYRGAQPLRRSSSIPSRISAARSRVSTSAAGSSRMRRAR